MVRSRDRSRAHAALLCCVVLVVVVALSGCPKKQQVAAPAGPTSAGPSGAPSADAPAGGTEVTLTVELVDQWKASMEDPAVVAALAEVKPQGQVEIAQLADTADKAGEHPELGKAVTDHGFADGTEWATVTKRVYAGILPIMIEQAKDQARSGMSDPAKAEAAVKEMDGKIDEVKAAFGELSDTEMKIVEEAIEDLMKAMG